MMYFPPAQTAPASSISSTPTDAEVFPMIRAIWRWAKKSPFPREPTPNSPMPDTGRLEGKKITGQRRGVVHFLDNCAGKGGCIGGVWCF